MNIQAVATSPWLHPIDAHMVPWYPKSTLHKGKSMPIHRKALIPPLSEASEGYSLFRLAKLCPILAMSAGE